MMLHDLGTIAFWWLLLFIVGNSLLPLVTRIFPRFVDRGYIFSKIISLAVLSYFSFVLGIMHLVPFSQVSLLLLLAILYGGIYGFFLKDLRKIFTGRLLSLAILEELFFFLVMSFWTLVRGFNPEVHGLEKYMDFGFMNSILRSTYFPPKDMWMTPYSINYYYFGHFYSAVLTKLSGLPSHMTYNLLLGMIAGLCFAASLSFGMTLLSPFSLRFRKIKIVLGGLLSAFLVTFGGNLHTIYTLFKPYANEHPVPPWQLAYSPKTFPNMYWYPNATRFIYNTIHEFPIYSWIVSDLHGHVLDIPFVLLTIAMLYSIFTNPRSETRNPKSDTHFTLTTFFRISLFEFRYFFLVGFLLAVMYMTNAWDGLIYLLLAGLIILYLEWQRVQKDRLANTTNNPLLQILPKNEKRKRLVYFLLDNWIIDLLIGLFVYLFIIFASFLLFSLPFSLFFKPFVSGIGILCTPSFLTKLGHLGPFLFEENHCQHSPWWQLLILYGFFLFFIVSLLAFLRNKIKTTSDIFVLLLTFLAIILIIIPEFIYAKDIYPAHYRANTMFKLVFQSFIMLMLVSGYTIMRLLSVQKWRIPGGKLFWGAISGILLVGVFIYPYFGIMSYYNNLSVYQGIDGTTYLKNLYPTDFAAIEWLNSHVKGQPVILEAQGDSYTDFARVSANTGLPTVLGWTVHEWLWRGEYDYAPDDPHRQTDKTPYYPAPRIGEVQTLYESPDLKLTKDLIKKYHIQYVFIGDLERQKYLNLDESKWSRLGKIVYQNGQTRIYKLNV